MNLKLSRDMIKKLNLLFDGNAGEFPVVDANLGEWRHQALQSPVWFSYSP